MTDPIFELVGARRLLTTRALRVDRRFFLAPEGAWSRREVVMVRQVAVIIPWDGERVHFIRQFRGAVGQWLLELPAGKIDAGESAEETARRECREEIGLEPDTLELLHSLYTSPGFTDELSHIFLATDLTEHATDPDSPEERAGERISMTLTEIESRLGELADLKTLAGIQALLRRA